MNTEQIRKLLEEGKLIIGLNESKRALESSQITKVLVASNAPASEVAVMSDYARMAGVEVVSLEIKNDMLGTMCRKPFAISFLSVRK